MNYTKFEELLMLSGRYIHKEESINLIKKAYNFAKEHHEGQLRKSGEPYIIHPLNVACILAEINTGPATICAGLLHDVVEDTNVTLEEIAEEFNSDIEKVLKGNDNINNSDEFKFFCDVINNIKKNDTQIYLYIISNINKGEAIINELSLTRNVMIKYKNKQLNIPRKTVRIIRKNGK